MSTEHEVASNDSIERKSVICLFDVDGTLTNPRQVKHITTCIVLLQFCKNKTHVFLKKDYKRKHARVYGKAQTKGDCWNCRRFGFGQNS